MRQLKQLLEYARIGAPDAEVDQVAPGRVVTVRFPAWDEEQTFLLGSREEAAHASIEVLLPDLAPGRRRPRPAGRQHRHLHAAPTARR